MEQERQFKGVWIEKDVWLDKRLNALEKVILVEIDSLDNEESGCYASNKYLAEFCQCSECKVSLAISKLIELDYLELKSFDGRTRVLKSRLLNFKRQDYKNLKADLKNLKDNNIYNNKENNIDNIKKNIIKKETETEFEELWKIYPNKQGKTNAFKSYDKARKKGVEFETIKKGLENYIEYCKTKKMEKQYIKHGSTWFNQECWNDEYNLKGDNYGNKPKLPDWVKVY